MKYVNNVGKFILA